MQWFDFVGTCPEVQASTPSPPPVELSPEGFEAQIVTIELGPEGAVDTVDDPTRE